MAHPPPPTAVPGYIGLTGLGGLAIGLGISWLTGTQPAITLVLLTVSTAAPMWYLEWRRVCYVARGRTKLAGLSRTSRVRFSWRVRGLLCACATWGLTLGIIPLADSGVLSGFWDATAILWPLVVGIILTFLCVQPAGPPAGLEKLGQWCSHARRRPMSRIPWDLIRGLLVKAFFLPLMMAFAFDWAAASRSAPPDSRLQWYFLPLAVMYLIDTVFAIVGYLSTSRRLDSHIRSSNPFWLGWASALICYPPFFIWLKALGFSYRDDITWHDWLAPGHPAAWLWGSAILLCTGVYAWSTVAFGIRFSNLTHRGIVTSGPYRWTKHPAYLSKNASWWLISIPFIAISVSHAVIHSLILLTINAIYWARAITEERHLSTDSLYREYAAWIRDHGLLAKAKFLTGAKAACAQ